MMHLTRIADYDTNMMLGLFKRAQQFALAADPATASRHAGRIVATLFYEPSTRTRLSFESAALRLGARCLGFADPSASSVSKGETLVDTIRTVQRYSDLIVLRHPGEGAATLAKKVAMVPIVNAGDGGHEHPSQTLFDLYTIWQRFGSLEGRTIGFVGDLRYGRTVHSLAQAAAAFKMRLHFIAQDELQMPEHLLGGLHCQTPVQRFDSLDAVIGELDVLYVTRVQQERMDEATRRHIRAGEIITPQTLAHAKRELLVLHPLPRVDEIAPEVDEDPRGQYFEQVANGVVVRMALLDFLLEASPPPTLGAMASPQHYDDPPWRVVAGSPACGNARCVTNTERSVQPRWEGEGERRCSYCDWQP